MNEQQLLQASLTSIRTQQLTNMICCPLCHNFFRFAHTLIDCGHTFCQLCLINYIKTFKGRSPVIKCPQCHAAVDNGNFKRSVFKDVYKQQLVDMLVPEYAENDKKIISKVQQIFPEFDLNGLIQNFKYEGWQLTKNKKKQQIEQQNNRNNNKQSILSLPQKIRERYGVSLQQFGSRIATSQQSIQKIFPQNKNNNAQSSLIKQNLSNSMGNKNIPQKQQTILQIKARTQRDYKYIGINNQMKIGNIVIEKLQRYLQKKALDRISKTEDVPPQWMNKYDDRLDSKVYLFMGGKMLEPGDCIEDAIKSSKEKAIYYSLTP